MFTPPLALRSPRPPAPTWRSPSPALLVVGLVGLTACESSPPKGLDASGRPDAAPAPQDASVDAVVDAQAPAQDAWQPPPVDATVTLQGCEPGRYVGTYTCENTTALIREGALELELVVSDEVVDAGEACVELCDLIIRQGTGTISGNWAGLFDFDGQLEGGLDCATGAFEASVTEGLWGPPSLPLGTFFATFDGAYDAETTTIAGSSEISPAGADGCTGQIELRLSP